MSVATKIALAMISWVFSRDTQRPGYPQQRHRRRCRSPTPHSIVTYKDDQKGKFVNSYASHTLYGTKVKVLMSTTADQGIGKIGIKGAVLDLKFAK